MFKKLKALFDTREYEIEVVTEDYSREYEFTGELLEATLPDFAAVYPTDDPSSAKIYKGWEAIHLEDRYSSELSHKKKHESYDFVEQRFLKEEYYDT